MDIWTDTHIKRMLENTYKNADAFNTISISMREKEFDRSASTNQYQHNECPLDIHENVGLLSQTLPLTFLSLPVDPAPDFFVQ